jgi:hypothetical protein
MNPEDLERAARGLPIEALPALMEFMAAACLNPWGIGLRPGEVRERNMPEVVFGQDGQGIVSFLIDEEGRELLITQVAWVD